MITQIAIALEEQLRELGVPAEQSDNHIAPDEESSYCDVRIVGFSIYFRVTVRRIRLDVLRSDLPWSHTYFDYADPAFPESLLRAIRYAIRG